MPRRSALASVQLELHDNERGILRAHGALEQVKGAVARERLRDAAEAFDLATRQEKEIEAEYEAWKLLLEHNEASQWRSSERPRACAGPDRTTVS